jgi:hypothetical protein
MLFWEGLGLAGLVYIHLHPLANRFWSLNYFYNALFFCVAYPLLFVYRWKVTEGCLASLLWPVSFLLSWTLGASAYLWLVYILFIRGSVYYNGLIHHEVVMGGLFAFIYFPLLQPLWGISKHYSSLGELLKILLSSALGGFFGFLLGWFLNEKMGPMVGLESRRFLLWLGLTLLGLAIGAMGARKKS